MPPDTFGFGVPPQPEEETAAASAPISAKAEEAEAPKKQVVFEETCGTCRCFQPNPRDLNQGFCHARPPSNTFLIPDAQGRPITTTVWPVVARENRCHSDYVPKYRA